MVFKNVQTSVNKVFRINRRLHFQSGKRSRSNGNRESLFEGDRLGPRVSLLKLANQRRKHFGRNNRRFQRSTCRHWGAVCSSNNFQYCYKSVYYIQLGNSNTTTMHLSKIHGRPKWGIVVVVKVSADFIFISSRTVIRNYFFFYCRFLNSFGLLIIRLWVKWRPFCLTKECSRTQLRYISNKALHICLKVIFTEQIHQKCY